MIKEYSETVPIQYEQRNAGFMGMDIYVDERVFIPRPETELLVDVVCGNCALNDPFILDIGVGSGVVSLGIAKKIEGCSITALDVSSQALEVAEFNLSRHDVLSKVNLLESDMFSMLNDKDTGKFDVIVSNPPYVSESDYSKVDDWVRAEPQLALLAGPEGMDAINRIVLESWKFLKDNGMIALEIGYDQADKVKKLLADNSFHYIKSFKDFNGFERVIVGYKNG